jgi:hypothetical protein
MRIKNQEITIREHRAKMHLRRSSNTSVPARTTADYRRFFFAKIAFHLSL